MMEDLSDREYHLAELIENDPWLRRTLSNLSRIGSFTDPRDLFESLCVPVVGTQQDNRQLKALLGSALATVRWGRIEHAANLIRHETPQPPPDALRVWHVLPLTESLPFGDERVPRDGETVAVRGAIVPCEHGLHGSEHLLDAFSFQSEGVITRCLLWGDVARGEQKVAGRYRRILWRVPSAGAIDWRAIVRALFAEAADLAEGLGATPRHDGGGSYGDLAKAIRHTLAHTGSDWYQAYSYQDKEHAYIREQAVWPRLDVLYANGDHHRFKEVHRALATVWYDAHRAVGPDAAGRLLWTRASHLAEAQLADAGHRV